MTAPMLAEMGAKRDLKRKDLIFEPKLDGTRAILHKRGNAFKLVNRRGKDILPRYPELGPALRRIKAEGVVLDGEVVVYDKDGNPDFYKLAQREHVEGFKTEIRSDLFPATYVVFDILYLEGRNLKRKPLLERKKILSRMFRDSHRVEKMFYTREGSALWQAVKKRHLEGLMAKAVDSPYLNRRSDSWLKIKNLKTLDVVICGYTTGTGGRKAFGSIIVGAFEKDKLRYMGRVGTGFTGDEIEWILSKLKKLRAKNCPFGKVPPMDELKPERKVIWVKPRMVCEVRFMNLSRANRIMRAPAYLRMRNDKRSRECILV